MGDDERTELEKQARRLRLAESDMEQVAAACDTLAAIRMNEWSEWVMLTGIVVTFARPFTRSGIGALDKDEWAPEDDIGRRLFDQLFNLRDKLFAHTDVTQARGVVDLFAELGLEGGPRYVEDRQTLNPKALSSIAKLARVYEKAFADEAEKTEAALGGEPGVSG